MINTIKYQQTKKEKNMILDFSKIEETVKTQFYGGEKELRAHMNIDKNNKKKYFVDIDILTELS